MSALLQVRLARAVDVEHPCCENVAVVNPRPETPHAAELRCLDCGKFRGWLRREAMVFLEEITRRFGAPTTPLVLSDSSIGDHMMNKQRENSGVLFKNDKKQTENSPDYTGALDCGGVEHFISGWIKTAKSGTKFMSLSIKPKDKGTEDNKKAQKPQSRNDFHSDEIPF
jgi:hypothetical protein